MIADHYLQLRTELETALTGLRSASASFRAALRQSEELQRTFAELASRLR